MSQDPLDLEMAQGVSEPAPAKLNLYLHVGPPKANRRHDLDSLVAFVDVGERVDFVTDDTLGRLTLSLTGPFAEALAPDASNLVLQAAERFAQATGHALAGHITIDKQIPVAAGLGGGSADAAAMLRLLNRCTKAGLSNDALAALGAPLGGDVPACVHAKPVIMRGEGDVTLAHPPLPEAFVVLVNPGLPCSTASVYAAFDAGLSAGHSLSLLDPGAVRLTSTHFLADLARQRNDLARPAATIVPTIADICDLLESLDGLDLVRVAGSGASVFALTNSEAKASEAAAKVVERFPRYWVRWAPLLTGR